MFSLQLFVWNNKVDGTFLVGVLHHYSLAKTTDRTRDGPRGNGATVVPTVLSPHTTPLVQLVSFQQNL